MASICLIVPVLKNFMGFANLMASVDVPITPVVIDNWRENRGVSGGWNDGIERSMDADFAVVCNDDIVFYPGTINMLIDSMDGYDLMTASNVNGRNEVQTGIAEGVPDFSCFVIRPKEFVAKFGTFDENFRPAYFEDNDMAYRITLGGGRQAQNLDAKMIHEGSVTQNMDGPFVTSHMFEQNRNYYCAKWGGTPGNEAYTKPFNGMTGKTYKDWSQVS